MSNLTPRQHARKVAASKGLTSGRCPLGYTRPGPGQAPEPIPSVGPLIVHAVAKVIEGDSMTAVAGWLNEMGVRSASGNRLTRVSLDRTMRSRFWAGYIVLKGQHYPGAHEPIISPEMQADLELELAHRVGWNSTRGPSCKTTEEVSSGAVDAGKGSL
ncbi:MAG: recombinase family protein [Ornithinimicrobium sp.]